ncbi:MAG TPA: peptidylprolyl isomerase [Pyrinomonadaceae bacterium]|nr:peptidylprolyl isomerase [Pyrinomonadaceae bacterium]
MQTTHQAHGLRRTSAPLVLLALAASLFAAPSARATPQAKRPAASRGEARASGGVVAPDKLLRIVRAEDERRWEESDLGQLLADPSAAVRRRAALAAGRIGDEAAVAPLVRVLRTDADEGARATAAFALGEVESGAGADALLEALRSSKSASVRARAVEALGKIAGALPEAQAERRNQLGGAVVSVLTAEHGRPKQNRLLVLLGLTAALRARPAEGPRAVALFLDSKDARVRADAANALTRLRAKVSLERLRAMVTSERDAVVRANAARALGAAEDAAAFEVLLKAATTDADQRVRVSALRSVALLKDARAAAPLLRRAEELLAAYRSAQAGVAGRVPAETNELLEVATTIGRLLSNTDHEGAVELLRRVRGAGLSAPEVETALARIAPVAYLRDREVTELGRNGPGPDQVAYARRVSAVGQGLGELAGLTSAMVGNSAVSLQADAQMLLRSLMDDRQTPALAVPDLLRSLASFKPPDLPSVARAKLRADDVIVRATAADLLAELPPSEENARALAEALPRALRDEQLNDAALSTLAALARQRGEAATAAVRTALEVSDYLVRRRAADILRERGAGEARRVETVNTRNREADYARALGRAGKSVRAVVHTDKGAFTVELLADEAPLTVDNFVQLARRNYFNNVSFHRVVPNFVVQGGDPRGDGNGGPGYQIRCEINTVPYERGAVGMALSGKDTGGSQWFVTHSPQPHLDGGYTVFGRVVEGMDVVDRIARGDLIRSVVVTETARRAAKRNEE